MVSFSRATLVAVVGLVSVAAAAAGNSPRINYMLHCQGCHLPGGIGHPGIVPTMRGQVGLFLRSEEGRAYLVQVPGVAQSDLDNHQLADVLNWMLPEFDPDHVNLDFKKFTPDEVSRYRGTHLTSVSATRRALLISDE